MGFTVGERELQLRGELGVKAITIADATRLARERRRVVALEDVDAVAQSGLRMAAAGIRYLLAELREGAGVFAIVEREDL